MKRIVLFIVAVAAMVAVDAAPKSVEKTDMRVGTYNVWSHLARQWKIGRNEASETRCWENSRQAVAELIVKLDCDIMGLQEVTDLCRDDLNRLLRKCGGGHYKQLWINTYPEGYINALGKKTVVGNSILYNKRLLKVEKSQIYYLSPTPAQITKGWDEKRHYRAATMTTVRHKKTGQRFCFIATHGPLKREASAHAAEVLVNLDNYCNLEGLPTIVVGDMNAWPGQPFLDTMKSHYNDAFDHAEKRCGSIGTYASSKELETHFEKPRRRIDHIYYRSTDKGNIKVHTYTVNRDKYPIAGRQHYPSDHNPGYVNLTIE